MAAKLEKTKTAGIFKRGSCYVFSYRVDGKQKLESARTLVSRPCFTKPGRTSD